MIPFYTPFSDLFRGYNKGILWRNESKQIVEEKVIFGCPLAVTKVSNPFWKSCQCCFMNDFVFLLWSADISD